ncbi:MAG: 3'-5' exonuclease [Ilumatobacteraceae bacterium]
MLARTNEQVKLLHTALTRAGVPTERSAGRSPLEVCLRAAYRCTSREALATWADTQFGDGDDLARRVAEEADRYLTSGEPGGFRAWVEARSPFDDLEPDHRGEAVALLTFHAAKGREWWGVFVTGVEEGLVLHSSAMSPAQQAEEARLAYVAVTRAAHHLVLTAAEERNGRAAAPAAGSTPSWRAPWRTGPLPARTPPQGGGPTGSVHPWRAVARASGQPGAPSARTALRSLLEDPPADASALATRLGITETAAARLRPSPNPPDPRPDPSPASDAAATSPRRHRAATAATA